VNSTVAYSGTYSWVAAPLVRDANNPDKFAQNPFGNTVSNSANINLSGQANLVQLYNKIPYLKKINQKKAGQKEKKKAAPKKDPKDPAVPSKDAKKDSTKKKETAFDIVLENAAKFLMMLKNALCPGRRLVRAKKIGKASSICPKTCEIVQTVIASPTHRIDSTI
jgi:cell surface protein SprA